MSSSLLKYLEFEVTLGDVLPIGTAWVSVDDRVRGKNIKTISLITSHVFLVAGLSLYNDVYYVTAMNINTGSTTINAPTIKCIIGYE